MEDLKLDQINNNLTGFFTDIITFIENLWNALKRFFKLSDKATPTEPLFKE